MNTQPTTQSPKAKQFSEELNVLCAKYQYSLVPKIQSTENGIIPWLAIVEVLPPKGSPVVPGTLASDKKEVAIDPESGKEGKLLEKISEKKDKQ